eukprot:8477155-Alexandrium_andersonii.AAC.1
MSSRQSWMSETLPTLSTEFASRNLDCLRMLPGCPKPPSGPFCTFSATFSKTTFARRANTPSTLSSLPA